MKNIVFSLILVMLLCLLIISGRERNDFEELSVRAVGALFESPAAVEVFSLDEFSAAET